MTRMTRVTLDPNPKKPGPGRAGQGFIGSGSGSLWNHPRVTRANP